MLAQTDAKRTSDRELVSSRLISGPPPQVFGAWIDPEVFRAWWVPESAPITLVTCEMDARTGGTYHLVFSVGGETMEFYGTYLEVTPYSRLVWTNDEGGADAATITTVTLEDLGGKTSVVVHDLYPSAASLDEAIATGSTGAMPEQLGQLERLMISIVGNRI